MRRKKWISALCAALLVFSFGGMAVSAAEGEDTEKSEVVVTMPSRFQALTRRTDGGQGSMYTSL